MMSYDASGTIAFKNIYTDDPRGGFHLGHPLPLTIAKAVDESALFESSGAKPFAATEIIANAAYIAAANPTAIIALLDRLKSAEEALEWELAGPPAERAYLALLSIPMTTMLRHHAQSALAHVRDLVALSRGATHEEIQNEFEDRAASAHFDKFQGEE